MSLRQPSPKRKGDDANQGTVDACQTDALDDVDKMRLRATLPDEVTAVAENAVEEAQDGADCCAEHTRVDTREPPAASKHDERRTDELQTGQNEEESDRSSELIEGVFHSPESLLQPNGSRLSCGQQARRPNECWTTVRARYGTTTLIPLKPIGPAASSAC